MGTANETATSSNRENESSPAPSPGTKTIATTLKDAGYELTLRDGTAAGNINRLSTTAFIELEASAEDVDAIEQIIDEAGTTVEHYLIGPDDTTALPGWHSDGQTDSTTPTATILVVPATNPFPTPTKKAQHKASSL